MKRVLFILISLSFFVTCFGQNLKDYKKGNNLGISFFLNDFKTASDIRANGIVSVLNAHDLFKTSRMKPGLAVNYLSGLSNHVDFIATLGASFLQYPNKNFSAPGNDHLLLETTGSVNLKLLSDKYAVVPFIDLGVGASKYEKYFGAFMPIGVGLQLNIADEVFVLLNSQYRVPVTENTSYHFYHSLGITANIDKKKVAARVKEVELPVAVILDRDHDGVVDSLDACPDEPGLAALQGCPDRDGDGIADKDDKCPDIPGVARYRGCPVPDTDKDGVNDEEDKCPNEKGPASNFGCPVIDVVVVEKINKAAKNIFFATGSSKLLAKSFQSLKEVAQVLKDNPSYRIDISGYTDNTGSDDLNQKLSENRANSVKQYLIENGVEESRVTSAGYGKSKPIADNKTADGRAQNRRVEMSLR